uniref:Direct IAP-binding protein with low pI n=1 Tax=Lygus hesperus TaxID=30085 RepID=A0A0A9YGY3_LYGHE
MFRALARHLCRRYPTLAFTVAFCSSSPNLKPLELKQDPAQFSHKFLIQQASSVVTSATSQLLTQSVVAIIDTVEKYRLTVLELIQLVESREQIKGGEIADELSELITGSRLKANDLKSQLLELQAFMEYVEKLVTSAAETAFLAGAEYSSTSLSERMHSAQIQVRESLKSLQNLEHDLILLQKRIIIDTEV